MMTLIVAVLAAGLFAGAAIYINVVEHPARVSCGPELAIREFRPSYRRAAAMQAALAMVGCLAGVLAAWQLQDLATLVAAALLGLVVPFTFIVIFNLSSSSTRLFEGILKIIYKIFFGADTKGHCAE